MPINTGLPANSPEKLLLTYIMYIRFYRSWDETTFAPDDVSSWLYKIEVRNAADKIQYIGATAKKNRHDKI
jgi:hypothetical protein